jgi:mono/diheme cytochrome c family protein
MFCANQRNLVRWIVVGVAIVSLAGARSAAAKDARDQGEKVFADQKCALCHSVDGKGNKKGALDEVGTKLSSDEIRAWITDAKGMTEKTKAMRKPAMKTYTLSNGDLDILVAYLSAMKKS